MANSMYDFSFHGGHISFNTINAVSTHRPPSFYGWIVFYYIFYYVLYTLMKLPNS